MQPRSVLKAVKKIKAALQEAAAAVDEWAATAEEIGIALCPWAFGSIFWAISSLSVFCFDLFRGFWHRLSRYTRLVQCKCVTGSDFHVERSGYRRWDTLGMYLTCLHVGSMESVIHNQCHCQRTLPTACPFTALVTSNEQCLNRRVMSLPLELNVESGQESGMFEATVWCRCHIIETRIAVALLALELHEESLH